jgi:hypothetical protein
MKPIIVLFGNFGHGAKFLMVKQVVSVIAVLQRLEDLFAFPIFMPFCGLWEKYCVCLHIDTKNQDKQKDGFVLHFNFTTSLEFKYWCCSILYYILLFILLFLPGRGRLHVKPILVAIIITLCMDQAHSNVFTVDDLDYLFGANGCVEGIAFLFNLLHVYIFCLSSDCVVLVRS